MRGMAFGDAEGGSTLPEDIDAVEEPSRDT